jgi:ribosomal protein S18 acetylase RimI-like enzyme
MILYKGYKLDVKFDPEDKVFLFSLDETLDDQLLKEILAEIDSYLKTKIADKKYKILCLAPQEQLRIFAQEGFVAGTLNRIMICRKEKLNLCIFEPSIEGIQIILDKSSLLREDYQLQILALLKQHAYWAAEWERNNVTGRIDSASVCIALIDNEKIIGFARLITDKKIAYISDVIIDPNYRGKKIGTYLMSKLLKIASDLYPNVEHYTVMVASQGREVALALYNKLGFAVDSLENIESQKICYKFGLPFPELEKSREDFLRYIDSIKLKVGLS